MIPAVATIAGSDSGGGAGIQADIKTFTMHNVYGCSVVACLTAQNTQGVDSIYQVSAEFVRQQLECILNDIDITFIKTGMLFNKEIVEEVVQVLQKRPDLYVIVDPVMISTSGSFLIEPETIEIIKAKLLPLTYILTPNIPEAIEICEWKDPLNSVKDLRNLARKAGNFGSSYVLLKGGHFPLNGDEYCPDGNEVVDLIYNCKTGNFIEIRHSYIQTKHTHGTGCTLSAAIVSNLANRNSVESSIRMAIEFVENGIRQRFPVGKGSGPLNHIYSKLFAESFVSMSKKLKTNPTFDQAQSQWNNVYEMEKEALRKWESKGNVKGWPMPKELHQWYEEGNWPLNIEDVAMASKWKMTIGKVRPNKGKLESDPRNTTELVEKALANAFKEITKSLNCKTAILKAIGCITNIKYCGPATASVLLSRYTTDIPYMYDEALAFFKMQKYTKSAYGELFSLLDEVANSLGNDWNAKKVARTLWIANKVGLELTDPRNAE